MEILSLKWNNHQRVFAHQISELRNKEFCTDAILACDGKVYHVHRIILSTCSDYFHTIFKQTICKNPVVVIIKDISCRDIDYLLDYMYKGEINVRKDELTSLISAAENLCIKGLAVSDNCEQVLVVPDSRDVKKRSLKNDPVFLKQDIKKEDNHDNSSSDTFPIPYNLNNAVYHENEILNNSVKMEADENEMRVETPPIDERGLDTVFAKSTSLYKEDCLLNWQPSAASAPSNHDAQMDKGSVNKHQLGYIENPDFIPKLTKLLGNGSEQLRNPTRVRRTFTCSFCGRVFNYRTNQLAHERIHTGEKPFHCLYCPYKTALKGNLKNHIFTKHQVEWEDVKHLITRKTS